jgi:catecholate siderophore receptor
MANANRNKELFYIKPTIAALAVTFTGGTAYAADATNEEASTLPEVKVAAPKEKSSGYKAEKASSSKFTAPLLDTPKSVTVITEDVIRDTGSTSLEDALRTVPGITFGTAEGGGSIGDRPFIRGFDAQSAMYLDGVRSVGGQTREIFAIESIEVLKGPSGSYDGRGSAGGSINMVTKQPKAENFIAGSVGLGTDQYRRVTLDGNYAINEDVAVRMAVLSHTADTPGRDDVDVKKFGLAPSITFGMNSPTSLNLSYYYLKSDDVPDFGLPFPGTTATRSTANPSKPPSVDKDNYYGYNSRDFRKSEVNSGAATLKHAFTDDVIFKNVSRYDVTTNDYIVTVPDDSRNNVVNGFVYRSPKSRNATTQTVSNISDLSFAFDTLGFKNKANTGIEFSHERTHNRSYSIVNSPVGTNCGVNGNLLGTNCTSLENPDPNDPYTGTISDSPTLTTTRAITKSAYALDSIELTKQWIVNLGIRYDDFETQATSFNRATQLPGVTFENKSHFWNYQAGLVYKVQPNASIYTSWGTSSTPSGSTVGNGNDTLGTNNDLMPERSRSTEVGVKWDVLEDLALNAAIFHIEKTNARVLDPLGNPANGGDMKVKGFELGAAGKITAAWQAFAGYTYLDSEVVDGGRVSTGGVNVVGAADGNQFTNTPKNSASLWTTYALTPKVTIGGGAYYVDKQYGNVLNNTVIPSYTRLDLMAAYQIDKNLDLRLNIQNLTDERYFSSVHTHYAVVAPGRMGMLTLNFKY